MSAPVSETRTEGQRLLDAGDWLQRLYESPRDEKVLGEWLQWCVDSENLRAFERARAVWHGLDGVRVSRRPSTAWRRWAVAAAVVLGVGAILSSVVLMDRKSVVTLATETAQRKSEQLSDGSQVDLSARSVLKIHFTPAQREVLVEEGEAFFTVARDVGRPFTVVAGSLRVTALGTAFNVRRMPDKTVITVSDGRVSVEAEGKPEQKNVLAAGEQARYFASVSDVIVARVDPAVSSSWRGGVLKFVDEPLASVITDLNRYSRDPIVFADPGLGQRIYTGTVYDGRVDEWLKGLELIYPMRVEFGRGEIRLSAK